jgi:hypothetical protein
VLSALCSLYDRQWKDSTTLFNGIATSGEANPFLRDHLNVREGAWIGTVSGLRSYSVVKYLHQDVRTLTAFNTRQDDTT